jgi:hypothetical protein
MSSSHPSHEDDDAAADFTAAATALHTACEDDADPKSVVQSRRRTGLLIFSCLYSVLYVGAYFGWGPMQLLVRMFSATPLSD